MAASETEHQEQAPPRDNLVRATFPGEIGIRDIAGDTTSAMPTMTVGFARYDEWTHIASVFEGEFMERIAPGAFTKTIKENLSNMRVLFNHGKDPQLGSKVLGPISAIRDTEHGPVAEVPLLDTSYNRDLAPGLREGVYGSSFQFKVMKEEFNRDTERSDFNPEGLPERTILEAQVREFGPVTFPAYSGATAGVRSLTDDFMFGRFAPGTDVHATTPDPLDDSDHGFSDIKEAIVKEFTDSRDAFDKAHQETTVTGVTINGVTYSADPAGPVRDTTTAEAEPTHSVELLGVDDWPISEGLSRATPTDDDRQPAQTTDKEKEMGVIQDMRGRQDEIRRRLEEISGEHQGEVLINEDRAKWDELTAEWKDLDVRCAAEEERSEMLKAMTTDENHMEGGADGGHTPLRQFTNTASGTGTYVTKRSGGVKTPDNPHDFAEYTAQAQSVEQLHRMYDDGAKRAIERFDYPHPDARKDDVDAHLERVIREAESPDREVARRIILCGSPLYRQAYWKNLARQPLTNDEQRALAVGASSTGGAAVPVQVDPTLINTASVAINPLRAIARVFTTSSFQWQGVTSGGITTAYAAEGAAMSDNAPTLAAPTIQPERAQSFVPYSWELAQDWQSLEANISVEFQESKDKLEALKFAVGAGHASSEPLGVLTATNVAGTIVDTVLGTALSVADLYKVEVALDPRHQANASWVAHPSVFNKVRQFDTAGGANLLVQLGHGLPAELLGYPMFKATNIGTAGAALTATAVWIMFGDFKKFAIVDRLGMNTRVVDTITSGNTQGQINFPTGQSGLIAYWRNSSGALDSNAFRVGTISTSI